MPTALCQEVGPAVASCQTAAFGNAVGAHECWATGAPPSDAIALCRDCLSCAEPPLQPSPSALVMALVNSWTRRFRGSAVAKERSAAVRPRLSGGQEGAPSLCAGVDGLVRRAPPEAGLRPRRFGLRMAAEQAPEHRPQRWLVGVTPVAVDEDAAHQPPKDRSTGGLGCAPKGQPHQHVVQGALARRTGRPIVGCALDDSRTIPAVELDPSLPKCLPWGAIVGLNFQDKP
jgi:hypothetical protein